MKTAGACAILLVLAGSLATVSASEARAGSARLVAFFPQSQSSCPTGWRDFEVARGYVIVGTDDATLVGRTFGAPIEDRKAPVHSHAIKTEVEFSRTSIAFKEGDPGLLRIVAAPLPATASAGELGGYGLRIDGAVSRTSAGMPFIQYRLCEEIEPARAAWFPADTVQWFNGESCPADWELYGKAVGGWGRTIVPLPPDAGPDEAALVVPGTGDPHEGHLHGFALEPTMAAPASGSAALQLERAEALPYEPTLHWINVAASGGATRSLAETSQGVRLDLGPRDRQHAAYPVPFVHLRPCLKISDSDAVQVGGLAGVGLFTTGFYCETGLREVPSAHGRYLVALPRQRDGRPEPKNGVAFGDDPLASGQLPLHSHDIDIEVRLREIGVYPGRTAVIALSGLRASGGLARDATRLAGSTESASLGLPYVQLRFCFLPEPPQ